MNIYDFLLPEFRIGKPIRLIELFAGIGSQAMALRDLGADFEHYRVVESDKFAVKSYNAIHGTGFETADIRELDGAGLGICSTDRFCYIMTYSFPCQDLSVAGKQKGMAKGSGTRSGLLWEVERLLNECSELPQVLLMENVPQVHSKANMQDFQKWIGFLKSRGYSSYWQDLNAKDYDVAQNRKRTFMVSLLGRWNYRFPQKLPLERKLEDYLEEEVSGSFYIRTEKARKLLDRLAADGMLPGRAGCEMEGNEPKVFTDLTENMPAGKTVANCITAGSRGISNLRSCGNGVAERKKEIAGSVYTGVSDRFQRDMCRYARCLKSGKHDTGVVEVGRVVQAGNLENSGKWDNPQRGRVYDGRGIAPTLDTCQGGNLEPKTIVRSVGRNPDRPTDRTAGIPTEQRLEENSHGLCNALTGVQKNNMVFEKRGYSIRKLTPLECWRLMGVSDEDFHKAEAVNSNSQLYKQAGNSIVKDVLMAVFRQLLP